MVALWRYEPHDPAAVAAALRDYDGPLPAAGPVADLVNTLDVLERTSSPAPRRLFGEAWRLLMACSP